MQPKNLIHSHYIHRLETATDTQVQALARLLIDCVEGGASVSFMHPLPATRALAFWRFVLDGVARGERALLVAEDATGIVGTVQLVLSQPENQAHCAGLSKMLVHRRARRRGLGTALVQAAEGLACECGKSLLVLDTAKGGVASAWMLHEMASRQKIPLAIVFNTVNPILVQGAAFSGMTMLAGFDEDITAWVPNGAMVEIDPARKLLRVL